MSSPEGNQQRAKAKKQRLLDDGYRAIDSMARSISVPHGMVTAILDSLAHCRVVQLYLAS